MSLELKNVEKKVGIETHIHSTNLKLEKNTINVLLGSTLAGKTTLMQIMAGLDKPTTGEIWFNGENVTGKEVQKRNCSMVYQQFINYPNFTVFENIASPLKITGVNSNEIRERVGKVAELLGHEVFSVDIKQFENIDLAIDIEFLTKDLIPPNVTFEFLSRSFIF